MPQLLPATRQAKSLDSLLPSIQNLATDEERARFFALNSEFVKRSVVEDLAGRATSLLRVDPRDAEKLITTSTWLAEELDDDFARGKAHRARANFAHIKGDTSEALSHYDKARSFFLGIGSDLEAAVTASSSLQALGYLGLHERAMNDAEFARKIFERLGDRLRLARLNSNYATLLYHRDRWAEAAAHYEAAYRDFLEVGESQDVAVCLSNMAVCHLKQQNFVQALEFYKRTRSYCEQNGLTVLTASLDYNIAYLHYLRGQYTTALELYREARTRHSELGDQHHVDLCALNEADIYLELNLTGECVDLASLAYSGFSDRGLTLESAKALTVLAIANSRQGKSFLALELLAQAQELFRRDKTEKWVAVIDLYRATIFSRAGRPFEGRRLASKADAVFREFSLTAKSVACQILLGRLSLGDQDFERARSICLASLEALSDLDSPALLFQASFLLGDVERALGHRAQAIDAYKQAHEQLGRMTGAIQTEEQRIQALDDKLVIYETLVQALSDPGAEEDKYQAFAFIEKAKSRSLTDLLAFRAYALPETQPGRSKLADQVRTLREELNWYYRQIDLQEMKAEERPTDDVAALRRYSRQQETRLIRTLNQLQKTDREFSSVQEAFAADLPAIRDTLPSGTSLVEYYIAKGTVLAVVIDRERLEIVPVTLASTVDEVRLSLNSSMSRKAGLAKNNRAAEGSVSFGHLETLYQELVAPIEAFFSGHRLVVVPHGSLFYLPFHAFRDGRRFMSDSYAISYSPSATAYHLARLKPRTAQPSDLATSVTFATGMVEDGTNKLTQMLSESVRRSAVLSSASEEAFSKRVAGCRNLHLVTKAHLRQDNPMFSTILLGGDRVHLFDLFQLRLDLDLLAISGWGPGLEGKAKGTEVVGFIRGLLYAGARSVLTTLWDVADETWATFSRHFYSALEESCTEQQAFAIAAAALRLESDDPSHWAGFQIFGDTD